MAKSLIDIAKSATAVCEETIWGTLPRFHEFFTAFAEIIEIYNISPERIDSVDIDHEYEEVYIRCRGSVEVTVPFAVLKHDNPLHAAKIDYLCEKLANARKFHETAMVQVARELKVIEDCENKLAVLLTTPVELT